METLTNNSYKLLKDTGDSFLKNYLTSKNELDTFIEFKRWILDKVIDPHNIKLPSEIILEYYNYCIINFKNI